MNRVTRRVEFIEKPKERASRFLKRRIGLVNKASELSTLCGVDACMIIIAPKGINKNDEAVDFVWSSSSDSGVEKLIKKFKEVGAEDRRKRVCSLSEYYAGKKRKAESMLASLKKGNSEASKFSTWYSKFESMKEHELRDLANDLEIRIDNLKSRRELMKNKRVKTVISNGDNGFQSICMMEQRYVNPVEMNSLHYNSNNNCQAIVKNLMKMTMNSIEDEKNYDYQGSFNRQMKMATNLMENRNNNYVYEPIDMVKPDVVNPMVLPMFDQHTPMDSEPQFFFGPEQFVNHNSVAQTEVNVSSSFLMNPAMMSTDLPRSFVYDHNVLNVWVSDCMSMQQDYAYRNSRMEIRSSRQSFYGSSLPPLPPVMLDYSTNAHVSSQMQYSGQLGTLYNFQ